MSPPLTTASATLGAAPRPLPTSWLGASRRSLALFALWIVLVSILPMLPPFQITLLNHIGLYALTALGLVLLTGVAGMTSFGQAAFVGLGAYGAAWLTLGAPGGPTWLEPLAGSPW